MLKLKLQYFGHLTQRADSLEKTLRLGKTEGRRRRGQQRMRWLRQHGQLNGREFGPIPGEGKDREAWRAAVHGVTMDMPEQLSSNKNKESFQHTSDTHYQACSTADPDLITVPLLWRQQQNLTGSLKSPNHRGQSTS